MFRTLYLVQQQAENSRKRILFGMNDLRQRNVAFWGIDTSIRAYGLADTLMLRAEWTVAAATMWTRLNRCTPDEINLLLRCGYAGADASLRAQNLALKHSGG